MRTCYYELLEVPRTANAEDLKKAYRKQALVWHPDKNSDRLEQAHHQFTLIQEAYEVLSDPQERAWYDSHRDAILRGDDPNGTSPSGKVYDTTAGTTVEELMRYFSTTVYSDYDDSEKGFYTIFRKLFQKLDEEEQNASQLFDPDESDGDDGSSKEYMSYPSFGTSTTSVSDMHEFYNTWLTFSTAKSFRWLDKWRLNDAPDRRVKRVMEKENKKNRETGRREYNDTVCSLIAFVRKRDPRHKAFQAAEKARKEAQAAKTKAHIQQMRKAAAEKTAVYQEQEWARTESIFIESEEEIEATNEFYCAACKRSFKSEHQWSNHENSKKHIQRIEELRKEVLLDDEDIDELELKRKEENSSEGDDEGVHSDKNVDNKESSLNNTVVSSSSPESTQLDSTRTSDDDSNQPSGVLTPSLTSKKSKKKEKRKGPRFGFEGEEEDLIEKLNDVAKKATDISDLLNLHAKVSGGKKAKAKKGKMSRGIVFDDEEELDKTIAEKLARSIDIDKADNNAEVVDSPNNDGESKLSAKQKQKLRKEQKKKKEEQAAAAQLKCNVCGEIFLTRNQLFSHVKSLEHEMAAPVSFKKR